MRSVFIWLIGIGIVAAIAWYLYNFGKRSDQDTEIQQNETKTQ